MCGFLLENTYTTKDRKLENAEKKYFNLKENKGWI